MKLKETDLGNSKFLSIFLKLSGLFADFWSFTDNMQPSKLINIYMVIVINFRALLPHMYGDINKLFQCFVELVFFYFLFAHNIYSKLQHCFSIFKPFQSRALQDISQFSQYKPKCLNTAQVACPQHWSRMSRRRAQYVGGLCIYSIKVGLFII